MKVTIEAGQIKLTEDEYREMADIYQGYCVVCQEWTRDGTEPDARRYDCPVCEQRSVFGAEHCLVAGWVEFTDGEA